MVITVLGKSPAANDAGGACSGYLLTEGDFTLLLDCGSGVFPKLRQYTDYGSVDAVVISHLHADHFLDLIPFSFALRYSIRAPFPRPKLWAPPGSAAFFRRIGEVVRFDDQIATVFDLSEYAAHGQLSVGPFTVRFAPVPHYIETFACDIATASGTRLTFGADCGPNAALEQLAHNTDLLLIEATLEAVGEGDGFRGHMTAREAGALAANAGARRVVLTHFSDELDEDRVHAEGEAGFGSELTLARAGATYNV